MSIRQAIRLSVLELAGNLLPGSQCTLHPLCPCGYTRVVHPAGSAASDSGRSAAVPAPHVPRRRRRRHSTIEPSDGEDEDEGMGDLFGGDDDSSSEHGSESSEGVSLGDLFDEDYAQTATAPATATAISPAVKVKSAPACAEQGKLPPQPLMCTLVPCANPLPMTPHSLEQLSPLEERGVLVLACLVACQLKYAVNLNEWHRRTQAAALSCTPCQLGPAPPGRLLAGLPLFVGCLWVCICQVHCRGPHRPRRLWHPGGCVGCPHRLPRQAPAGAGPQRAAVWRRRLRGRGRCDCSRRHGEGPVLAMVRCAFATAAREDSTPFPCVVAATARTPVLYRSQCSLLSLWYSCSMANAADISPL
jgi:hypothetical protein